MGRDRETGVPLATVIAPDIDHLDADRWSAMGDAPVIVVNAGEFRRSAAPVQALVIGTDRAGGLPEVDAAAFDVLVTTHKAAPAPWVTVAPAKFDTHVERLADAARRFPVAATMLGSVLRLSEVLPFREALVVESLAYSTLLAGAEFRQWRAAQPVSSVAGIPAEYVCVEREADFVTLTLDDPTSRNAMTAAMRDALYAALANVLDDPTSPHVVLRGAGRCFSTGGALDEFGTASDLAQAHVIRTLHSCARALHDLGNRAEVRLHGACVGSGVEIPAAAARRIATADAWFHLPELRMGLIPGAGGTASVGHAIGRHRTAWLVLSGQRIGATQAREWGLIHAIENA